MRQIYKSSTMTQNFPIPPSHKTFQFGQVVIDSNFDSGNLFNVERVSNINYNIWIAVDHPKNQYRAWFHFSLKGLNKNTIVSFNLKNMQNQSKMLYEGLVPCYREESSREWKRVIHRVDTAAIQFNEGWIEWTFKHTMTSDEKVFFAFFYPWSNTDNDQFLKQIQQKCNAIEGIYYQRSNIINSLEGRPVQFLTISSKKGITNKNEKFDDNYLFPNGGEPKQFSSDKKCMVIGARVHPGEVPSSHVVTGIIEQLTEDTQKARILRDKFVFYIFPIFNPDGVARGHYRVDPNGINLNRCYINPSPKNHSPIYAVKKIIMHFHHQNKYFAFLDLHAHAARKGIFIYGNASDELQKQTQICLFPKILSMNSQNFEYEGSNFTQQNMYCKDKNDHVSKEGAGRVALFKATKNPYSWTLECNYNISRIVNILESQRNQNQKLIIPNQNDLDSDLIINYKYPQSKEPKQFYTIATFRKLGKEICESLIDLIGMNPNSRIDNPNSHFKSIQNLRLNLAVALLRMAPNRFENQFKKIYLTLEGPNSTKELAARGVKALYLLLIKKATIQNLNDFLRKNDDSSVVYPIIKKTLPSVKKNEPSSPSKSIVRIKKKNSEQLTKSLGNDQKCLMQSLQAETFNLHSTDRISSYLENGQLVEKQDKIQIFSNPLFNKMINQSNKDIRRFDKIKMVFTNVNSSLIPDAGSPQRIFFKPNQMVDIPSQSMRNYRKFSNKNSKINGNNQNTLRKIKTNKSTNKNLPVIVLSNMKACSIAAICSNDFKSIQTNNTLVSKFSCNDCL